MSEKIDVSKKILTKNEEKAAEIRKLFNRKNVLVVNIMSSPGSGKTTLLEKTLPIIKERLNVAVIEGDQQTENDADRVRKTGVPAYTVNTGMSCHLEAADIERIMNDLDLDALDLLIVENVGNLICPSEFDIGEDMKVVVLSTTEGEDKPAKYPTMFHVSAAMVINKIDLLPHLDFDVEASKQFARNINNDIEIFETSCRTGDGLGAFVDWLVGQVDARRG